jgi:hypothetical protein
MKQKVHSKGNLIDSGDIPLMPVMTMSDGNINFNNSSNVN